MVSELDVERQGLSVGPVREVMYDERTLGVNSPNGPRMVRVHKGIDPRFEYAPGQSRLSSAVPPLRAHDALPEPGARSSSGQSAGLPNRSPPGSLPKPRPTSADRLLPSGQTDEQYMARFQE